MPLTHSLKPIISLSSYSSPQSCFPPLTIKPQTKQLFFSTTSYNLPYPSLKFSRRLFLPSVSGIWDALTGNNDALEAVLAVRRGMLLFRQGDVLGSLAEFDKAMELDPRQKAYLWQRGLSLYYLDRFEEGAEQFRLDVAQNPNDTEESIWCFLCEAQLYGVEGARQCFLEIGRDPRPVMREAYSMFKNGGDPEKAANRMSTSMLHYMLGFIMNLRTNQTQPKFIYLLQPSLLMDKGLMIIWLLLPRSTVFVEIGTPSEILQSYSRY